MNVNELVKRAHEQAKKSGFWDLLATTEDLPPSVVKDIEDAGVAQKLALISTEIAEFEDEASSRELEAALEELSDIYIRVFDLCGYLGVSPGEDIFAEPLLRQCAGSTSAAARAMYRNVAQAVQAHRKERGEDLSNHLVKVLRIAHDYATYRFEDAYALPEAIECKMKKNETREYRHGAAY